MAFLPKSQILPTSLQYLKILKLRLWKIHSLQFVVHDILEEAPYHKLLILVLPNVYFIVSTQSYLAQQAHQKRSQAVGDIIFEPSSLHFEHDHHSINPAKPCHLHQPFLSLYEYTCGCECGLEQGSSMAVKLTNISPQPAETVRKFRI